MCLLALFLATAFADESAFTFDAATGTITGWQGEASQLTIPSDIDGIPVTAIATDSFCGLEALETVVFPDSIARIGRNAFVDCPSLSYLIFRGNTLPVLEVFAFRNCPIEDIDILWNATKEDVQAAQRAARQAGLSGKVWRSNAPGLELIGNGYTYSKDGKKGYVLAAYQGTQTHLYPHYALIETDGTELPVYAVGEAAFRDQKQLKAFGVPHSDQFTTIGNEAFAGSGLEWIDLYDSVTTIGEGAFRDCASLEQITLGSSLRRIGQDAFMGCTGLRALFLQCDKDALPEAAFADCTALTTVYADTAAIGDNLFQNSTVTEVTFGENVKTIGSSAFQASAITELVLPENITKVGKNAFADCTDLETVTILCYASGVSADAFTGCTALKTVHIAKGSIPAGFLKDSGIEVLTLGESVSAIGKDAFANAPLTGVVLPAQIKLEAGAFANVAPEQLRIVDEAEDKIINALNKTLERPWHLPVLRASDPYTVEKMPQLPTTRQGLLFDAATGMITGYTGSESTVIIPAELDGISVTGISSMSAPENTPSTIETLVLPESILTIGPEAFSGNTALRTFITYGAIENVGECAFLNCTALETAIFVNGVYNIGASAFDGCSSLRELWWPGTANSIGDHAFRSTAIECFALCARRFGKEAFSQCTKLTEVHLRPETEYVNTLVFDGCSSLRVICFEWNDSERFKRYAALGSVADDAVVILPAGSSQSRVRGMYRIVSTGNGGPVGTSDELLLAQCTFEESTAPDPLKLLESILIP